jgi:hypothetical protein
VNLLGGNIETIKKSTETLITASKKVGLEINIEKTKYMLLFHCPSKRSIFCLYMLLRRNGQNRWTGQSSNLLLVFASKVSHSWSQDE